MRFQKALIFTLLVCIPQTAESLKAEEDPPLEKSAYFAYVDREFIFTVEVVEPGIPILNFVSMVDREEKLQAKNVRLSLGNRQEVVEIFHIEANRNQQPFKVVSLRMHPRSSFGFRLEGNFSKTKELYGAEITLDSEKFKLEPLSEFDFETLVLKVNRINLGSPDFAEDFRVLKLTFMGSRSTKRR